MKRTPIGSFERGTVSIPSSIATSALMIFFIAISNEQVHAQPTMFCQLSDTTAAPGDSVRLDVFLENFTDVRGYQTTIAITPISGSGEVTVPCPGGVTVDLNRADYIFSGLDTINLTPDCPNCGVIAPYCQGRRAVAAMIVGHQDFGGGRYLASYTLEVSSDAAPGSTFEISILPFPSSIVGAEDNSPIPFIVGPPCMLTVEPPRVPTVSAWGLVVLALVLLVGAKIYFTRRNSVIAKASMLILMACFGLWAAARAAMGGPPCSNDAACQDGSVCTFDRCVGGACANTLAGHGDVAGVGGCGPDGTVDVQDINAMRNALRNVFNAGCSAQQLDIESVTGCTSDGAIDLFDLFGVLSAFSGISKCPCLPTTLDVEPPMDEPCAAPCAECTGCRQGGGSDAINSTYLFSGEVYHSAVDLRIPGRGLDFVWCRKYRSKIGPNTAQGNGWDFSYNIYVETAGDDIVVHDGNTRSDIYTGPVNGPWTRAEFFRELKRNPDNSYTLTFPDTGVWNFHPLNGSPQAGKISSIVDRNGNTIALAYDPMGRLVTITDTLNRNINIAYTGDGHIDSVTDFINRQVKFEYYSNADAGGSAGDLKSARTPIVIGTPNGNDFPLGKTFVYTYSKGFVDDRLNHNLKTITDPKGQTYQINEYYSATNPHDLNFDRLSRQTWGNAGETIEAVYVPQTPSPANNMAKQKAIVNDRVGNVSEHFYDDDNRMVMEREYAGRWSPAGPTTDADLAAGPTTPKLRPTDPNFFETRHEYNDDSLPTRTIHPNDNEETYEYDDANLDRRSQGNMLKSTRKPGPLGGNQIDIIEEFEYDDDFGGCCGTNFVKKHVDPRGNITIHDYDTDGNRTHTQHRIPVIVEDFEYNSFGQMTKRILPDNGSGCRRVDVYEYYEPIDGPQNGYLKKEIIDATTPESCPGSHFGITTTYEYDAVGNVIRVIDPRGHDSFSIYNALNQVVRTISRLVSDALAVRYTTDTFYDANDNVVRTDVENRDETGAVQPNDHFTTIVEYDILNNRRKTCMEKDDINIPPGQVTCPVPPDPQSPNMITTITEYDANHNPIRHHSGEAVNGNQPNNVTETIYDERDMPLRTTRAPADADKSTTQTDYDANGNVIRTTGGTEDPGNPRITITEYDGYDRVIRTIDPMGNETIVEYDANGNRVSTRTDGAPTNDTPGGASNVRLSETTYEYDAMDRVIRTDTSFFDTQTQAPIGDGFSTTITEYTDNSQVKRVVDDKNHQTVTEYDTANRQRVVIDHKGNSVTYDYDANSNVISVTELEKSDLGNPDQSYITITEYDNLDRAVRTVDQAGNTMESRYDSRSNRTVMIDALNRITRYVYDGLSRLLRTIRDLNGDGADPLAMPGDGNPDIVTAQTWDDNSRLTAQIDDSGNPTTYIYDALNRRTAEDYADCTVHSYTYDVHDNRITMTDANGSVVTFLYDLNDRAISKSIVPGPGVAGALDGGTTAETYEYDGLSRLIRAEDNDSLVTRQYDSLSNITREVQNQVPPFSMGDERVVLSTYDGVGNKLTCTYPGGRVITTTYDELDRKKTITDDDAGPPPPIATYDYVGPGRVERRDYRNGTRMQYSYDGILPNSPNDFGVKQIVRTRHTVIGTICSSDTDCPTGASCDIPASTCVIDDRTFTWDRMGNKTQRKDVRVGGPQLTHDYSYDAIYRLVHTVVTDAASMVVRDEQYDLDGVGNRTQVTGGDNPGMYTMDPTLCEPADRQLNQYTTTSFDGREYDKNGNLIRIDEPPAGAPTLKEIRYDYRNMMVEYKDHDSGGPLPLVHTYAYDALGRRIRKVVDSTGVAGGPTETRFYLDGWQEIEEQDGMGNTEATYVFGLYIDEVLNMRMDTNGDTVPEDYFYHADDLYNVMAVTDAVGAPAERYEYTDYGTPLDPSSLGNPLHFTGRRYDHETSFYNFRTRHYDPRTARFITRDLPGMWSDRDNVGNGTGYCGNNPFSSIDPFGLDNIRFIISFIDDYTTASAYRYQRDFRSGVRMIGIVSPDYAKKLANGNWMDKLLHSELIAAKDENSVSVMVAEILGKLKKGDCIQSIEITGHGVPSGWFNRLDVAELLNKPLRQEQGEQPADYQARVTAAKSKVAALNKLRGNWCCPNDGITMLMCFTAGGAEGTLFLSALQYHTQNHEEGSKVVGWTGIYGPFGGAGTRTEVTPKKGPVLEWNVYQEWTMNRGVDTEMRDFIYGIYTK